MEVGKELSSLSLGHPGLQSFVGVCSFGGRTILMVEAGQQLLLFSELGLQPGETDGAPDQARFPGSTLPFHAPEPFTPSANSQ